MIYLSVLILAVQLVIAWRVSRYRDENLETLALCGEYWEINKKILGEIKVKQEEFDKKVDALTEKVSGLDSKLDNESGEIAGIVAGYKSEIQRLKEAHDDLDTSRLDALGSSLEEVGTRIGGLVDPMPSDDQASPTAEPSPTVDATATATANATPATNVETETTVTTTTESAGETAAATATTESGEATAEASVDNTSSDSDDEK